MPNRYQLAFLATFVGVFSSLSALAYFAKKKLREAGYDISELILIGLPKDKDSAGNSYTQKPSSPFTSEKASMYAQLLALVLAACTTVVIYWKFGSSEFGRAQC